MSSREVPEETVVIGARYRLDAPIGQGAQGTTWRALDLVTGHSVALKRLAAVPAGARLGVVMGLDAPSLVRVLDFGGCEGGGFVVMELVTGTPLDAVAEEVCVTAAGDLADALDALHRRGFVHGDVKPANVIVREGRAVLVDLDLVARVRSGIGKVDGTLALLAPEALLGERSAQTDLHALGVTLTWCLGGGHPFVEDLGSPDAVREAMAPRRRLRGSVMARVPARLREALGWLLAWAPEDRPPSAAAWRARWRRDAGLEAGATLGNGEAEHLRPPRVGHEGAVQETATALAEGLRGDSLGVILVGPPGAGRRRIAEDALRVAQVESVCRGARLDLAMEIPREARGPTIVCCLDSDSESIRAHAEALLRRRRYAPDAAPVAILATCTETSAAQGFRSITVPPLDRGQTQRLLNALHGDRVPAAAVEAWAEVTAGLAGRVVRLARRIGAEAVGRATRAALFGELARDRGIALPRALDPAARSLAAALAPIVTPVPIIVLRKAFGDAAVDALHAAGMLACSDGTVRLAISLDHADLTPEDRAAAVAVLAGLEGVREPELIAARGRALGALGRTDDAYAEMLRAAARVEVSRDVAVGWLREASPWSRDGSAHRLRVATAMGVGGDPAGAAEILRDETSSEAVILRLDALRRAGETGSIRALGKALTASGDPALRAAGALALARDAYDRGELAEAHARYAEASSAPMISWWSLDLGALLALSSDEFDLADDRIERAELDALRKGDALRRHRLRTLAGMVALRRGDPRAALRCHRDALELALVAGDSESAARYRVNVGGAALDAGELGEALRNLERAVEALANLARLDALARALGNLASLLAWIGDRESAVDHARRAAAAAREAQDPLGAVFARAVLAELAGEVDGLLSAAAATAELGEFARAEELRARALAQCVALGELERARELRGGHGAMATLASLALVLATPLAPGRLAEALTLAERTVIAEPSAEHTLWWLTLAEEAAQRQGRHDEAAARRVARRERVRALAATLPDALAQIFRRTWEPVEPSPPRTESAARWQRLAAVTRRLSAEARLPALLELVMDAIIELTGAERGFVLLREEGTLAVRTARNVGARALEGSEMSFSRSVAERVATTGEALVTLDAAHDARFDAAESVVALQLRSILAVPLRVRGEVVGTVYVDDRLRAGAFDDGAVEVALAFAEAAAVAIQNARARRELELALRRAEKLSEELDETVARQRAELEVARQSSHTEGLRGRYESLVGSGPAMARMLALLDRVAPTAMPVLLLGESGTGKELVARELHTNSPRRGAPFVAENCGAIPEALLESTLFGHVRGAFTGADRARAGLFEVADGGTLFLDEIGEMPLPMQARLLRVLQEGEVRPVGGERVRRVDVRVIAATHRDLTDMVRRGLFREDLYYRLAVLVVPVPALRERREDIPALVAHFLTQHGKGLAIERGALARLVAAPWPGNVRELENEVRRAAVFASGATIREADLSAAIIGDPMRARGTGEVKGTDLRDAVQEVERALVERVLREHGGNQSRAAQALGLSRFGLQKKLKRLGIKPRPAAGRGGAQ